MKHRILIGALGVAALALPASASAAQRTYQAPLVSCTTGLDVTQRSLEVDARMSPIPGAVRMGVRFDLLQRTPTTGAFAPVAAPGLGVWKRSHKKVPSFELDQRVDSLAAPASYEMRVGFRWYSATGHVLRTKHKLTKVCHQPDLRPNLVIRSVLVSLDKRHYTVIVRNNGGSPAGPFSVGFTPPSAPAQTLPIAGLAAATQTRVTFTGPACNPASPPTFVADAGNQVAERDEADNSATATC